MARGNKPILSKVRLSQRKIGRELAKILGNKVSWEPGILASYEGTASIYPKSLPDFVCIPETVNDIRAILKVASKYRIPVTPVASATQEPGVHPFFGGIVVDVMKMKKMEIDVERGYAVVEPGVTVGELSKALAPLRRRIAIGSFPPEISVIGNFTQLAVNSHRSSGILDDIIALEVVLPDGSILHTGSKAFSDQWLFTNSLPELKGLFINACGTLGIITKAAVRIYDLGETQEMPLAGFQNYKDAVRFMREVSRLNIVQHVCGWHWKLYTIIDHLEIYKHGAGADVLVWEPWEVPDERPYIVVVPSISGAKENVNGSKKAFERIAKERRGKIVTEYIKEKFQGAFKFFEDHYKYHKPTRTFMGAYGEGLPMMGITLNDPVKVEELEEFGLKFLWNSPLKVGLTYYSHIVDQGRAVFLRFTPFVSHEDKEFKKALRTRAKYIKLAMKKFGATPIRPPYSEEDGEFIRKTGTYGKVLTLIKKAIDPLNIMNSGMSVNLYGKENLKCQKFIDTLS